MNKKDIAKLKKELEEEKQELIDNLKDLEIEYEEVSDTMPTEQIEQASYNDTLRYLTNHIQRNRKKIDAINHTLSRMENNSFGKCKKCSKKIKNDRLQTIPTTLYCAKCAS